MCKPGPSNTKLMIYCALIAVCLVARLFSVWVSFITHSSFSSRAGYTMRSKLMDKLVKIPLGSLLSMDLGTINNTLLKEGTISEIDLKLISIVDTESEVIQIIDKFYENYLLKPNF